MQPTHTCGIFYQSATTSQSSPDCVTSPRTLLIPKEASKASPTSYLGEGGGEGHLVQVELGHALEGDGEHDAQAAEVQAGSLEDVRVDGLGALQDLPRGCQQCECYDLPRREQSFSERSGCPRSMPRTFIHPKTLGWGLSRETPVPRPSSQGTFC